MYDQVGDARRAALHRRIGTRQEQGYGERAAEIAAELAVHFERGRDGTRAVQYPWLAAQNASRRYAHGEALAFVSKGFTLLTSLPETPARLWHELRLQVIRGAALIYTEGPAAA